MATSLRILLLTAIFSTCSASVFGQDSEIGWANYYSDYYQGRATAYGEIYDRAQLSCAHKSYPAGTLLRVTRMDSRRSVIVRVNDKGPIAEGFLVTLSLEGALSLGMEQTGKARVLVEPVGFAQNPQPVTSNSYSRYESPDAYDQSLIPRNPYAATAPGTASLYPLNRTALMPRTNSAAPATETVVQNPYNPYNPYTTDYQNVNVTNTYPPASGPTGYEYPVNTAPADMASRSPFAASTRTSGFGIQLGAYSSKENAERQAQAVQVLGIGDVFVVPGTSSNGVVYRVIAGAAGTRPEAEAYRRQLVAQFRLSGFIVEF